LVILGILILLAVTLPEKHFFSGMALGLSIGLYNLWLLQRKVNLQADAAAREGKRIGTGSISRFAAAALGAIIAMRFEWSMIGYIIGLMTIYPVIIIGFFWRSEEHTSELQSRFDLVCRLLLEKK